MKKNDEINNGRAIQEHQIINGRHFQRGNTAIKLASLCNEVHSYLNSPNGEM